MSHVEQELIILSEHLSSLTPPDFSAQSLVLCIVFCRSLFIFCLFYFWSLYYLSFFDLRLFEQLFGIFKLVLGKKKWHSWFWNIQKPTKFNRNIFVSLSYASDVQGAPLEVVNGMTVNKVTYLPWLSCLSSSSWQYCRLPHRKLKMWVWLQIKEHLN